MKKVSLMIAALALVLGISQCKKDEKPAASGEKQHIVLSASFGDSNSKIAEDGTGGLKWTDENGGTADVIKVYNSSKENIGTLTCKNAANGIFEGDITTATGDITFTFGEQKFTEQTGALNDAISLSATTAYDPTGNYNVTMTMPHAVLKLNVSALGASGELTISDGTSVVASVTDVTTPSEVFVAVPADGSQKNYTIGFGGKTATKVWPLAANTFYTKSGSTTGEAIVIEADAPTAPEGALPGLFTVGKGVDGQAGTDDDVKVYFSQGNLQYQAKPGTWRFAENQYDFVGNGSDGNVYEGGVKCNNASIASDYTGWIDLFGWGSTGNAPAGDGYYVHYQPWSTDNSSDGHSSEYNHYGYGPSTNSSSPNLSVSNGSDWGKNIGDGNTWRMLTGGSNGEWYYLLEQRTMKTVDFRYTNKTGGVTISDATYKGLFIYPDDYNGTEVGVDETTGTWDKINGLGIVFLPAAGYRSGTSVSRVGSYGYYWSSSYSNSSSAYFPYFDSGDVYPDGSNVRYNGRSVRLVSEN